MDSSRDVTDRLLWGLFVRHVEICSQNCWVSLYWSVSLIHPPHPTMYQKYHPTPQWESSSASGLINGQGLFEVVYSHAFWSMMHKSSPANKVRLEDGNFVWFPEKWARKCTIITGAVISMASEVAGGFQSETYSIFDHTSISSFLQSLLSRLSGATASALNHKTRSGRT